MNRVLRSYRFLRSRSFRLGLLLRVSLESRIPVRFEVAVGMGSAFLRWLPDFSCQAVRVAG